MELRLYCKNTGKLLFFLHVLYQTSEAIRWIGIARKPKHLSSWNTTSDCSTSRKYGLMAAQVEICKGHLDLMDSVIHAAKLSTRTCTNIFKATRWNCSSLLQTPKVTPDLNTGTREQAYVYSISSAAMTHSIARTCSLGLTQRCGCGRLPDSPTSLKFKWDGCSDNMPYGIKFATMFGDAPYNHVKYRRTKRSKKALMNQHNMISGRKVVIDSLLVKCKCHGVSGSCALKSCWQALPSFMAIGEKLRKKYQLAVAVTKKKVRNNRQLVPISRQRRAFRDDELVFINASPDYCNPDKSTGSVGTRGRLCDKYSRDSFGCGSMCCGRGFWTRHYTKFERCHCKYIWCCYVKCQKCLKSATDYRCR
uniref:Protein Wnt n=1 Tax=Terebratalia transversa TaxID=34513 RepID=A0AAU7EA93_TERTR